MTKITRGINQIEVQIRARWDIHNFEFEINGGVLNLYERTTNKKGSNYLKFVRQEPVPLDVDLDFSDQDLSSLVNKAVAKKLVGHLRKRILEGTVPYRGETEFEREYLRVMEQITSFCAHTQIDRIVSREYHARDLTSGKEFQGSVYGIEKDGKIFFV